MSPMSNGFLGRFADPVPVPYWILAAMFAAGALGSLYAFGAGVAARYPSTEWIGFACLWVTIGLFLAAVFLPSSDADEDAARHGNSHADQGEKEVAPGRGQGPAGNEARDEVTERALGAQGEVPA